MYLFENVDNFLKSTKNQYYRLKIISLTKQICFVSEIVLNFSSLFFWLLLLVV